MVDPPEQLTLSEIRTEKEWTNFHVINACFFAGDGKAALDNSQ